MTQSEKFTFANLENIKDGRHAIAEPPKKRMYSDAQIQEIQNTAYSDGVRMGEQAALAGIAKRTEETLDQLFSQFSLTLSSVEEQIKLLRRQSAGLALVIAKKMVPALIASNPTAEIESLFMSCVANLNAEPRIVIRVEEELLDQLKEKIETMTRMAGYPGRVVLIGEPQSIPAQCQIEWPDGGVTLRSTEQLDRIDLMIAEYVAGGSEAGGFASHSSD